jgi:hypothetical protein
MAELMVASSDQKRSFTLWFVHQPKLPLNTLSFEKPAQICVAKVKISIAVFDFGLQSCP